MKKQLLAFAALGFIGLLAQVPFPDSAASRQFQAWLNALNGGDRAAMRQFTESNMPTLRPGFTEFAYDQSNGLDAEKVESATESEIVVLARERGPRKQLLRVSMRVGADSKITDVRLQPVDPPAQSAARKLTPTELEAARKGVPFRQFSAWLDAFNSGNESRLAEFAAKSFPSMNAAALMGFRRQTGGFELHELERATPTTLGGTLKERDSDQFARFLIEIEPAEPNRILRLPINAIPRPADVPAPQMTEAELISALRAKLDHDGRFAGAVMVSKAGATLFSGAYGLADREKQIPNKVDTRFRIGSMNKMFTATAVLQLAQAGKLKLSDPIGKYIKDYPNSEVATKVTIHHLLTHTGGTGDIFGPEFEEHRLELKTLNDYVALYGKRAPAFEPGSRFSYSNYGMILAGVVVERVTGQTYYDYVDEHIFKPAGMTMSGSKPENENVPGRAVGYMRPRGASADWTANTETLPYRGTSAGGGYSTVGDLVKFGEALLRHKLLNSEYTDLLITGKIDAGPGRYAYGFEDARKDGIGSVGHGGGAPGMNGDLRIFPVSGYIIAVLSNLDPPAAQQISSFVALRLPR